MSFSQLAILSATVLSSAHLSRLGNCDIWLEQNILVLNETKQCEIEMIFKFGALQIIHSWLNCLIKGFNDILHKFLSFCMDESERNEGKGYFMLKRLFFLTTIHFEEILMKIYRQLTRIRQCSMEFSKKLQSFTAFYGHKS